MNSQTGEASDDPSSCYSAEQIRELFSDASDTTLEQLIQHIDHCQSCSARVDALESLPIFQQGHCLSTDGGQAAIETRPVDASESTESNPVVDGLRVHRLIGRGGMGEVYQATDSSLKCEVAVKVMQKRFQFQAGIDRFQREKMLQAAHGHPNIVNLLYETETANGRPCFVMEYLDGLTLTRYCDANRLSIHQKLELLATICDAVQHLHGELVIHRDLAPKNIIVVELDQKPVPKIIDFGLAKLLTSQQSDHEIGYASDMLGSESYMSPEQTGGRYNEIGVRSDIYSLGVVMYELLTGAPPLPQSQLASMSSEQISMAIQTEQPPSLEIACRASFQNQSRSQNPDHAAGKPLTKSDLSILRYETQYVVSRALAKDPAERYGSAAKMAADIRVFLNGGVLEETNPSSIRRLSSWSRAHRSKAMLIATLAVMTPIVILAMAWGLVNQQASLSMQTKMTRTANQNVQLANEKLEVENKARIATERQNEKLDTLNKGLQAIFEGFNPTIAAAGEGKLREAFVVRLKKLADEIVTGDLGDNDKGVLMKGELARTLGVFGESASSLKIWQSIVDDLMKRKGEDNADTLSGIVNLGMAQIPVDPQAARKTLCRSREIGSRIYPEGHPITWQLTHYFATACEAAGDPQSAFEMYEPLMKQLAQAGNEPRNLWRDATNSFAVTLMSLGQYEEAKPVLETALQAFQEIFDETHLFALKIRQNLALAQSKTGETSEAVKNGRMILESMESQLIADSPQVLEARFNLATFLALDESIDEAETLLREIAASKAKPTLIYRARIELASLDFLYSKDKKKNSKATTALQELSKELDAELGVEHPVTKLAKLRLGQSQNQ